MVQYRVMDGSSEQNSNLNDDHLIVSEQSAETNEVKPLATAIPPRGAEGSISWTASEFIVHKKSPLWYLFLFFGSMILAYVIWLLTGDVISASVIAIAGILLMIYGAKRPHEINYRIDREGVHVGNRSIQFDKLRSFSIAHQGAFSSLVLFPMKRFSMLTTAYYDPQDEQKILDIISSYLPLEEKGRDLIDELLWKIRF